MAVALTLVRLKLTLLRRSMTGSRGAWMVAGAVVGTGLAVSTIVLSALYRTSPAILGDLLGVVYALWLAGLIAGPVSGGAPLLRAEHFALIPATGPPHLSTGHGTRRSQPGPEETAPYRTRVQRSRSGRRISPGAEAGPQAVRQAGSPAESVG